MRRRPARKSGIRMIGEAPIARGRPTKRIVIEVGKAYTARKGSALRIQFGPGAVYMVLAEPSMAGTHQLVQVLSPTGMTLCYATDLRPCEEPEDIE